MRRRFSGLRSSATHEAAGTISPLGMVGDRDAVVNLSQARLLDSKRLVRKIGMLDERTFRDLTRALAYTLFPSLTLK